LGAKDFNPGDRVALPEHVDFEFDVVFDFLFLDTTWDYLAKCSAKESDLFCLVTRRFTSPICCCILFLTNCWVLPMYFFPVVRQVVETKVVCHIVNVAAGTFVHPVAECYRIFELRLAVQ
jgi:hypothetical protein